MVSSGGLYNPVGKSVKAINKALTDDTAKTLLKSKLKLEEIASKAKTLSKPMVNVVKTKVASITPKTGQLAKYSNLSKSVKLGSKIGIGLIAGAGLAGYAAIKKASKGVDKAVEEANKASQNTAQKSLEFGAELRKRKQETGMSLSERKKAREKKEEKEYLKKMKSTDFKAWK